MATSAAARLRLETRECAGRVYLPHLSCYSLDDCAMDMPPLKGEAAFKPPKTAGGAAFELLVWW